MKDTAGVAGVTRGLRGFEIGEDRVVGDEGVWAATGEMRMEVRGREWSRRGREVARGDRFETRAVGKDAGVANAR